MLIEVFSVLSMLSKLPPGVCRRGGGGATGLLNKGGRLPSLVTKHNKLWNFHRYRLVIIKSATTLSDACARLNFLGGEHFMKRPYFKFCYNKITVHPCKHGRNFSEFIIM